VPVSVLEYLGKNVEKQTDVTPVDYENPPQCPFMGIPCTKVRKKLKPVCSVRKTNGDMWIVCSNRLCSSMKIQPATRQVVPLVEHQVEVLHQIAKLIYGSDISLDDILIKREVSIPVVDNQRYSADYIMKRKNAPAGYADNIVLEMQGGGETANTKNISNRVGVWEQNPELGLQFLRELVNANTIESNAWRRQQEQFIVKGNVADQTGGRIVFCVGKVLYDYIWSRVRSAGLPSLQDHNWTLALVPFVEDLAADGSIKLKIDPNRKLFTNYARFLNVLINQGLPCAEMFTGSFVNLKNEEEII